MLRHPRLEQQYAEAFPEWDASPDKELWDSTGDGIG